MLKFFRRIRYNLLSKGQTGKPALPVGRYLKYAIGEILLVVIGILIALQVNEWNSERNRKIAEEKIIAQLKTDLLSSEVELEKIMEFFLDRTRESAYVLRAFYTTDIPEDFLNYYRAAWQNKVYSPVLSTARSLINSGNVELLSSVKFKNELVSYVEYVDYKLKDINRYEETYYRKAIEKLSKELIRSAYSIEQANQYMAYRNNGAFYNDYLELDIDRLPDKLDKIPFELDLDAFFKDIEVYDGYHLIYTAHRNIGEVYGDILERTHSLLNTLDEITGTSSIAILPINPEDINLVFDSLDLKIIQEADALLSDSSKWNKVDDRSCIDDFSDERYSLFCALHKASIEITGEYSPRRSAVEMVKLVMQKYNQRRMVWRNTVDWNNHPNTSFEDIKKVLKESIDEVRKQL